MNYPSEWMTFSDERAGRYRYKHKGSGVIRDTLMAVEKVFKKGATQAAKKVAKVATEKASQKLGEVVAEKGADKTQQILRKRRPAEKSARKTPASGRK